MKNFLKINKKEAENLYNKALFKTFFHNPEWQDFLEREFRWLKFEHYLYKDEFLLSFGRMGRKLISLPFCEYGGPLILKQTPDFEKFNKDVLQEFKNIKIKFHPRIKSGDSNSSMSTHWIENLDKLSTEQLYSSFRKTLRHSIRNAQKHNLEIKKCSPPAGGLKELKQFYNLYVDNLRRRKTVPYPFSVIEFLYQKSDTNLQMTSESTNSTNVDILLAKHRNKIIGGDLFLHYNGFVHYFLSASDYKYRNLGASYLILWEKIKKSLGRDYKVFDLGAAPKGSALEIFKRGWRGKEYPILQIGIKRSEESLRSSKLRNIWGLLPNFVIKKISPYLIKYRL